jgi:hypothetical protein
MGLGQTPGTVPSPGIEGTVVARFLNSVVGLVVLDNMTTPCTVANAYGCPRHVMDQIMASRNPLRTGDVDARDLFAENSAIVYQIIVGFAFERKGTLGPGRPFQISHETNGTVASFSEFASADR